MLRLTHAGVLLLLKKPANGSYRISLRVMRESAEKHTAKGLFGPCARGGAARDAFSTSYACRPQCTSAAIDE